MLKTWYCMVNWILNCFLNSEEILNDKMVLPNQSKGMKSNF